MKTIFSLVLFSVFATDSLASTIEITSCNYSITQPGHYRVDADLDCSGLPAPYGIKILNTYDVELDLGGHTLTGRPHPTYGGLGRGVYVYNSNNVKIDGTRSSTLLQNWQQAIYITNSSDIEIDGDYMWVKNSNVGIMAHQSDGLSFDETKFRGNINRDVYLSDTSAVEIERFSLYGNTRQGVLVSKSNQVVVKRSKFGVDTAMSRGIIVYDSTGTTIERNEFDRLAVAISLTGQTSVTHIDDNEFGDEQQNDCDIQVILGADLAYLDDNEPSQLAVCN